MVGRPPRASVGGRHPDPPRSADAVRRPRPRAGDTANLHPRELRAAQFVSEAAPFRRAARQDAGVMGDQIARAVAELIHGASAEAPLLIVLDDVHWGDLPSLRLLDAALRTSADRPLALICLARPE